MSVDAILICKGKFWKNRYEIKCFEGNKHLYVKMHTPLMPQ